MSPPEVKRSWVLPLEARVAADDSVLVERRVPFDGDITEVLMASSSLSFDTYMRLVYYKEAGVKELVIPSIEDAYIRLPIYLIPFRSFRFPVKEGGRLVAEFYNDDTATYSFSMVVTLEKRG